MTDKQTMEILVSRDERKMRDLAADESCDPAVLFVLSQAPFASVRTAAASNPATPRQADAMLSGDQDNAVRCTLASKVARRANASPAQLTEQARKASEHVLKLLIQDQEVRVRRIIASEVMAAQNIPKEVVLTLARDLDGEVCCPVIENSPLLDDDDLISIIADCLHAPALAAIARRDHVGEAVSDKLVDTMDVNAVAALLRNPNAQLREDTLDRVIEAAEDIEMWHAPLVARPTLPTRVISRISEFVSEKLLDELAGRSELDQETRDLLAAKVQSRLNLEHAVFGDQDAFSRCVRQDIERLKDQGRLTVEFIDQAIEEENHATVRMALAVLAGIEDTVVYRIFASRSAKAVTALCWKSGMPMSLSEKLQRGVSRISARYCLLATPDGAYPMKESELEWHLGLFVAAGETKSTAPVTAQALVSQV